VGGREKKADDRGLDDGFRERARKEDTEGKGRTWRSAAPWSSCQIGFQPSL